jgi:hypothetical protein
MLNSWALGAFSAERDGNSVSVKSGENARDATSMLRFG